MLTNSNRLNSHQDYFSEPINYEHSLDINSNERINQNFDNFHQIMDINQLQYQQYSGIYDYQSDVSGAIHSNQDYFYNNNMDRQFQEEIIKAQRFTTLLIIFFTILSIIGFGETIILRKIQWIIYFFFNLWQVIYFYFVVLAKLKLLYQQSQENHLNIFESVEIMNEKTGFEIFLYALTSRKLCANLNLLVYISNVNLVLIQLSKYSIPFWYGFLQLVIPLSVMMCIFLLLIFFPFIICAQNADLNNNEFDEQQFQQQEQQSRVERQLEGRQFKDVQQNQEEKQCSICLDYFINPDLVYQVPCKGRHIFHENCIRVWFESHNQCPLCRQIIQ